ncbi:MAG: NAD(P)-dependent glycerol-3-phosphate dehydrogenase [Yoonia sp.]|nr:NAD(P)-dependent glycerol-3-phosphate dehydrogenase [Yoonia sp.]
MMIAVAGGGAFGTALAVALALDGKPVTLWARDPIAVKTMQDTRQNPRLTDITLPAPIIVTNDLDDLFAADIILLATPAQTLRGFLTEHADHLAGKSLIACCKGIDLTTMTGPVDTIRKAVPSATAGILTGPSFAADIARGLPTALTLACSDEDKCTALQAVLSTQTLRLYRTTDTIGAELGGALKNVMAIVCGVCMGAGLGESARAALITRGFAEMQRLATRLGADPDTLHGLSGFGDLALTCTSDQSRNYRYGQAIGSGKPFDKSITVEGAATAQAVQKLAKSLDIDLPICTVAADLSMQKTDVATALKSLLSRPLKEE